MNPNSPDYQFDPNSIGWLHRRHNAKDKILKEDIVRLLEANPDNASDPVLQCYLLPALKGKLKGDRGRPRASMGGIARYWVAWTIYLERLAEFHRELRDGTRVREKYTEEPSIQIADEVAKEFGLRCSGRSFLNKISVMKKAEQ